MKTCQVDQCALYVAVILTLSCTSCDSHALRTVVAAVRAAHAVVRAALAITCPARFKPCSAVVSAVRTV